MPIALVRRGKVASSVLAGAKPGASPKLSVSCRASSVWPVWSLAQFSSIRAGRYYASLWYKLARANGIAGDGEQAAGRVLSVPAGVVRSTYNAGTYAPYDPADALGDVSPLAPQPTAAAHKAKCGAFGAILLAVVAVAAAAIVGPAIIGGPAVLGANGAVVTAATGLTAIGLLGDVRLGIDASMPFSGQSAS